MNEIRVLHIGLSSNIGGMESVVNNWMKYLPDDIRFDFVSVEEKALAFESEWVKKGSIIYKIVPRKKNPMKSTRQLKKIIMEGNYAYIHYHAMSLSWAEPILLADKYSSTKKIIHSHTTFGGDELFRNKILNFIGYVRLRGKEYYKLACGNEAGKSMFKDSSFQVIENGIDLGNMKYSQDKRQKIREQYDINENDFLIGHVGRPSYPKNYPFIIETFASIAKERKNIKLMLIGDVINDAEIKGLIEKHKIKENLIMTGSVKNTADYYSAMDLFFLPSHYEGLSVSLVEAQAMGLPCVVSNNIARESAISNLVEFVSIRNCDEAVKVICDLSDEKRERKNGKIDEKYDLERVAKKIFNFYRENI